MNGCTIADDWSDYRDLARHGIVKIFRATFVSFLTTRAIVKEFGLPIKEYFIWGDDTEFSLRISKKYPSYFVSNSIVTHKIADNRKTSDMSDMTDKTRVERMALSLRNDCCTYRRMGIKNFLRYNLNTMRKFFRSLKSKTLRGTKIKVILKGYFTGLVFHPKIEKVE